MKLFLAIMLILVATCQAQRETLVVASTMAIPPFDFYEDGEATGFDIDFLDAIADQQGFDYDIVQADFPELFELVKNGEVDMGISGLTITAERGEIYDFSRPYYLATHKVLVHESSTLGSASDLSGQTVGVLNGTTGQLAAEEILGAGNPNIILYSSSEAAFDALANGHITAYLDDNGSVEFLAKNNPGYRVVEDDEAFDKQFYGLMFPKGSELVDQINPSITEMLQDGTYTDIYETWFSGSPDVELLLAAGNLEDPYDVFNTEVAASR